MIDVEKFICSLMRFTPVSKEVKYLINCALKDQGLEYKDGKIVEIEEKKEELTKFEDIVVEIARPAYLDSYGVKGLAKFILSNAKKQLQEEFDKQLEQAYKNADKVQYKRGYKQAIEDAVRYMDKVWGLNILGNSIDDFRETMEQKLKELSQG